MFSRLISRTNRRTSSHTSRAPRGTRHRRPILEAFEPRTLLSTLPTGIEGTKYLDVAGEMAPSSIPFELRAYAEIGVADGLINQAEYDAGPAATTTTDAFGQYFLGVEPGQEYVVVELAHASYSQVQGDASSVLAAGLVMNTTDGILSPFGYSVDMTYAGTIFSADNEGAGTIGILDVSLAQPTLIPTAFPVMAALGDTNAPNSIAFDLNTNTVAYSSFDSNDNDGPTTLFLYDIDTGMTGDAELQGQVSSGTFHDGFFYYFVNLTGELRRAPLIVNGSGNTLGDSEHVTTVTTGDTAVPYVFGDIAFQGDVLYGFATVRTNNVVQFFSVDLSVPEMPTYQVIKGSGYTYTDDGQVGIAFDKNGVLYGVARGTSTSGDDKVSVINLADGGLTQVGANTLPSAVTINDLASDLVVTRDFVNAPRGGSGLSHGYWKNHLGAWEEYTSNQTLGSAFLGVNWAGLGINANTSLLDALKFGGGSGVSGAARNLLKQAVGALLNATSSNINYFYTEAEVLSLTVSALNSLDRNTMLSLAAIFDDLTD